MMSANFTGDPLMLLNVLVAQRICPALLVLQNSDMEDGRYEKMAGMNR